MRFALSDAPFRPAGDTILNQELLCWGCGARIEDEPMPLSTYAACPQCRAQLHTCRMCRNWNPRLHSDCDETRAESVSDREKANFCDWFVLQPDGYSPVDSKQSVASRSELDKLFGDETVSDNFARPDQARSKLDDLFGGGQDG